MRRPALIAACAIFAAGSLPATAGTHVGVPDRHALRTICGIKSEAFLPGRQDQTVLLTTEVYYDFEHGYFLSDPSCHDQVDGTGVLRIEFSDQQSIGDFPRLERIASQGFQRSIVGKHTYCACIGRISYGDGYPRFVLIRVKSIWASA